MHRVKTLRSKHLLALVAACGLLTGCGGGSSSEDGSAEPTGKAVPAPTTKKEFDPTDPPSDDRVRQDLTNPGVLEIELGKKGKKSWNSAHSQYFWEKYAVVKRNAHLSGVKDAKVIIKGWARYEITDGKYNYREFKVGSNEYEGIPSPTDEEAIAFIKTKLADFLRGPASSMVNTDKIEVTMAGPDEQKWVWHNANSVSF